MHRTPNFYCTILIVLQSTELEKSQIFFLRIQEYHLRLAFSQVYDSGSETYPNFIIHALRICVVILHKFQKHSVRTHTFLKTYERLRLASVLGHPVLLQAGRTAEHLLQKMMKNFRMHRNILYVDGLSIYNAPD